MSFCDSARLKVLLGAWRQIGGQHTAAMAGFYAGAAVILLDGDEIPGYTRL